MRSMIQPGRIFFYVFLAVMIYGSDTFAKMDNKQFTINDFLSTAKKDFTLENHRELEEYLKIAPSSTPYLDKVEFRTQTEDFELKKQKYSLRLYPKGWGETGCNQLLAEKMKQAIMIEQKSYFNTALKTRYRLLLDFFKTTSLIKLKKQLLTVYEDRLNVLKQKRADNIEFDINALIVAEGRYTDLRIDLVTLENNLTSILHKIKIAADEQTLNRVSFAATDVIGVQRIERQIKNITLDPNLDNISLQDRQSKIEIARIKYDLEIAKNKDYLNLIEFSYDMDERQDYEQAVSIKFGFKLPGIHPDREQINSRKLKYLQERLKYEGEKRQAREKALSLLRSLKRLIEQYTILITRKENSNAGNSFKTFIKMEGIDPLHLLKFKESILTSDMRINKVIYLIRFKYIDLMDETGKLAARPLKNYLTVQTELEQTDNIL